MSRGLIKDFKDLRDFRDFKVRRAIEEFEGRKVLSESVFLPHLLANVKEKLYLCTEKTKETPN